jgi:hypothetical protein
MMMSKEHSATSARRKPVVQGSSNDRPVNKRSYTIKRVKPDLAQSGEVGGFWSLWSSSLGNSNGSVSGSSTATPVSSPPKKINDVDIVSPQSPGSMFQASAKEIGKFMPLGGLYEDLGRSQDFLEHSDVMEEKLDVATQESSPYSTGTGTNTGTSSPKRSSKAKQSPHKWGKPTDPQDVTEARSSQWLGSPTETTNRGKRTSHRIKEPDVPPSPDSDDDNEHYEDDDDASWNKAKVQPYPSLAPNNLNSKSLKVYNDSLSSSSIPSILTPVSAAPKRPFDVTSKKTPNDTTKSSSLSSPKDPQSVLSSATGTYRKTVTTSTREMVSSHVAAESKPQKAASDSNLLSSNENNTNSATIPCTAATTPVTAKERMGGKRFSNALLTFESPSTVRRNYRISQWARSKQANLDLLEPHTADLPLASELKLARERLKAVTTKERPIGGGFHSTEADLLKQLRQWKNFAPGNVQEENEYQQYLMDLLQALKSVSGNHFPTTLSAQEVNDIGYATVPLKKVHKELDTRESSHADDIAIAIAIAIGSILKTLKSIGSETPMDQAQDIVQDAIDRLRHVASYSKLHDGQQKDVLDVAEQLQRVSYRMTEREVNALGTALRCSDRNDSRAMDDFAKILIELRRNLRRAQPVQRQFHASQVPLVNLKRASCVRRQLPESHGPSATLRKTSPVNRELSNHQHPSVQLRKTTSAENEGEQFMKKARKCLGSIDIQPDEAHALARMIVNFKDVSDYQNQPNLCDEQILALSIALSEDTFDQVSDLMDEYCKVVLNRPHRAELIDLIFGSVVQEKGGNGSDSDFSSDDEDDDDFDEESQFGGSVTDWIEQIEEGSVYTEETVEFDDQFEVASRDEDDFEEVDDANDSTDDESMAFVPAQDPVEKVCTNRAL